MIRLRLLGSVIVEGPEGPLSGRTTQRARVALLAVLGVARGQPVSRDRLLALFWPEHETADARHLLADSVYLLRKSLGESALISTGDSLALDSTLVGSDVADFRDALDRGDFEAAVAIFQAPFLDGFYLSGCAEFERWVDEERGRLAREFAKALERIAEDRSGRGLTRDASDAWRRLAASDPSNVRIALRYMEALVANGERAAALQHARNHAAYLKKEFDAEPEAQLMAFAERLRTAPENGAPISSIDPRNPGVPSVQLPTTGASGATGAPDDTLLAGPRGLSTDARPDSERATNRRRARRRVVLTGTGAVLIVAVLLVLLRTRNPALDPKLVLVDVLENQTGDSTLSPLGFLASDWIGLGLEQTGVVRVNVTYVPLFVKRYGEPPQSSSALPLARTAHAGTVIRGRYYKVGDSVAFVVQVSDVRNGEVTHMVGPVKSPLRQPEVAVETLRGKTMAWMAVIHDPQFNHYANEANPPPSLEAYQTYVGADPAPTPRSLIDRFARAAKLAPQWELPVIHEVLARWGQDDFRRADSVLKRLDSIPLSRFATASRDMFRGLLDDDVPAADRAMRQWVAEAPTSAPGVFFLIHVLLTENRPHELLDVAHRFDWRNAPPENLDGPPAYILAALHFAGDYAGELHEAQRREKLPNHDAWMSFLLASESRALSALGRARELDSVFDRMLAITSRADISPARAMLTSAEELMGHGHAADAPAVLRRALQWVNARTDTISQAEVDLLHARVLYELGQRDQAQSIAAKLPRAGSPREAAPWALLGAIAARRGDRAEALRISSYLATTPMNDLADHVELAQAKIAMALGDRESAMSHLLRACGRGCDAFLSFLESDYDLLALHSDPRFIALTRPKG